MGPEDAARMVRLLAGLKRRHTHPAVEHDMDAVFGLADRISVLVYGRVIATGDATEIRNNEEVRRAYLGDEDWLTSEARFSSAFLDAGYDESQVLFGVSFEMAVGEVVTLLGRNGMGKTTTIVRSLASCRRELVRRVHRPVPR